VSPWAGISPAPPAFTVAEVLRVGLPGHAREHPPPPQHWKVLRAITACRTPELGGHLYQCSNCAERRFVPHSCRNRHCPTCQGANGFAWMQEQASLLLPIPYFHIVFTLPHALNPLIRQNQAAGFDLLFSSASNTLLEFGRRQLGAQLGITSVLHTWSQTLIGHYHLHCIVTGGGLREDGTWAGTPAHWLFPVRALSAMFQGKFRSGLQQLHRDGALQFHGQQKAFEAPDSFAEFLGKAVDKKWIVYAKRPFAGPRVVLAYLARYTHRIGITNHRILALNKTAHKVSFAYKDYADDSRKKTMSLSCEEFVRRLRLHILPERFVKIRHYGILANCNRHLKIQQARAALPPEPASVTISTQGSAADAAAPEVPVGLPVSCPHCHKPAAWILIERIPHPHQRPSCTVPYLDSS